MMAAIPTELMWRLMNATPEQYAAVCRILGMAEGQVSSFKGSAAEESGLGERTHGTEVTDQNAQHPTLNVQRSKAGSGEVARGLGVKPEDEGRRSQTAATSEEVARNVFRRAGSHWDVRFAGGPAFHLEDTVGARYLDYLLHRRGEVITAFDLEVAIAPEKAQVRARDSIQAQLDPETVRSYLHALTRLRAEREMAAEAGDMARADQLDADLEAVEVALQAQGRATGDAGERARNNVRKAVGAVLGRLSRGDKAEREVAAHLAECVRLGFEVMYQPRDGEVWE
jgi:hypothetical protein